MLGAWDVSLFRWINSGWNGAFGDELFRFFSLAAKLPFMIVLFAVVLVIHLIAGGALRRGAALAMLAWPIANALCDVFKGLLASARPCVELAGVNLVNEYGGRVMYLDSSGTASAHSANMAAIATVLTIEAKWWGAPWILFAFLTGLSRVYTGVHYPSQVLLGWMVGMLCGFVVSRTWHAYRAHRKKIKAALVPQPPIQSRTD